MEEYVYALELSNKKYYIGRTKDIIKTFRLHKEGFSQWTKKYPANSIVELFGQEERESCELALILKYMTLYGKENVRGGPFATEVLEPIQQSMIALLSKQLSFTEPRVVTVYQCEENKYFVDSWPLADLPNRFQDHQTGNATNSPFTTRFRVLSIVEMQMDGPLLFNHLRLTIKYMKKHGFQHVRGSIFSSGEIDHSLTETAVIQRLLHVSDGIYDDEGNLVESFDIVDEESIIE